MQFKVGDYVTIKRDATSYELCGCCTDLIFGKPYKVINIDVESECIRLYISKMYPHWGVKKECLLKYNKQLEFNFMKE